MKKESKIFVAGHKGLVGSAIVRALEGDGYNNIIGFLDVFYVDKDNPRTVISFYKNQEKIKIEKFIDLTRKHIK